MSQEIVCEHLQKVQQEKIRHIRELAALNKLSFAAKNNPKECGQMDAAKLMRNALITITTAKKFLPMYKNCSILHADVKKDKLNEEALVLIMDAKLSKQQYTLARPKAKG
jgi:hypothetical protein